MFGAVVRLFGLCTLDGRMPGRNIFGKDCKDIGVRLCLDMDVSTILYGYVARCRMDTNGFICSARGCHVNVSAINGHIATGIAVAYRRNHIGLGRRIQGAVAGNGKVTVLNSNGALPGIGRYGVDARHADGEVALGADGASVVAVELHVVSAIPGPGSRLVAGSGARVVLRAADVDPLGGERHARQQQLADHEHTGPRASKFCPHAAPRSVRERARAVVVDWVVMDLLSHVSLLVVRGASVTPCYGKIAGSRGTNSQVAHLPAQKATSAQSPRGVFAFQRPAHTILVYNRGNGYSVHPKDRS